MRPPIRCWCLAAVFPSEFASSGLAGYVNQGCLPVCAAPDSLPLKIGFVWWS
jgi:hypothetical protein